MSINSMKAVNQVFEQYQKARVNFVQSVADLAQNPKNIEALKEGDVFSLLRPLLLDTGTLLTIVPSLTLQAHSLHTLILFTVLFTQSHSLSIT
jgi:hypothetical protein